MFICTTLGLLLVVIFTIAFHKISACYIHGTDSGECQSPEKFAFEIPFCQDMVTYNACVPKYNSLYPDHTVANKDRWIKNTFNRTVEQRMLHETNETLKDLGINELGEEGEVVQRYYENEGCSRKLIAIRLYCHIVVEDFYLHSNVIVYLYACIYPTDCINAYKAFYCWSNFPRCNSEGMSLIMCRSVCENFYKACKYAEDLHRCGPSEYHNGKGISIIMNNWI